MTMQMTKAFYIVSPKENWYRLHLTSTHYCLGACDNLNSLLGTVKSLTKKYRTEHKLIAGLSKMEDGGHINSKTYDIYSQEYDNFHEDYDDIVESAVKAALEEVKFDTPFHRAMKRTHSIRLMEKEISAEDNRKPTPETPLARKPRLKKW